MRSVPFPSRRPRGLGPDGGHPPPLTFAIIGAQRSRTTYLNECLRRHPGIFSPHAEVAYFEDPSWASARPAFLQAFFEGARPDQVLGLKRPELLGRSECPARLASMYPGLRLILVLREPVARTVSAYFHYVRVGFLPVRPLNNGLRALLDRQLDHVPHATEVLGFSQYGRGLARYLDHFDRSAVCTILETDLDDDLSATLRRVCRHVGADPNLAEAAQRGTNDGIYSLPRLRWLRLGTRFVYTRDRRSGLMRGHYSRWRSVANQAVYQADRLVVRPFAANTPPALEDDVRARLHDELAPDVELLSAQLERSLPGWPA